ncbi:MAG: hypothetical protein DMG21_18405 [Acidobacteria bacterium]|nr:MAG: hypothetical protein DMG21_18405 [Acidobacteriota bacterium]
MNETVEQILLVAAILGGSALVTQAFARAMYIVCGRCRTLNARRRQECRRCGALLRTVNAKK